MGFTLIFIVYSAYGKKKEIAAEKVRLDQLKVAKVHEENLRMTRAGTIRSNNDVRKTHKRATSDLTKVVP